MGCGACPEIAAAPFPALEKLSLTMTPPCRMGSPRHHHCAPMRDPRHPPGAHSDVPTRRGSGAAALSRLLGSTERPRPSGDRGVRAAAASTCSEMAPGGSTSSRSSLPSPSCSSVHATSTSSAPTDERGRSCPAPARPPSAPSSVPRSHSLLALSEPWQFAVLGAAAITLLVLRRGVLMTLLAAALCGLVAAQLGAPLP